MGTCQIVFVNEYGDCYCNCHHCSAHKLVVTERVWVTEWKCSPCNSWCCCPSSVDPHTAGRDELESEHVDHVCTHKKKERSYNIAGNFRGRKLLQISQFCGYSQKFSLRNLGHGILWHGTSEQPAKVFSVKIVFFTIPQKFSPSKVSHYIAITLSNHK